MYMKVTALRKIWGNTIMLFMFLLGSQGSLSFSGTLLRMDNLGFYFGVGVLFSFIVVELAFLSSQTV